MVSRETSQNGGGIGAEIRAGIRDTWAVGLGLVPLGLAFGMVITQAGFDWWWAPIFSIVIYAGSMEFLAVNLVLSGVGPVSAAITGFMVNFRHIFYGLTFPRDRIRSALGRAYSTYALTDESYAIASAIEMSSRRGANKPLSGPRLLTIQILCQSLWVMPGIIGALVGNVIPSHIHGMEYALNALFLVLAWEAFQGNKDWSLPTFALAIALLAIVVIPNQLLIAALVGYFAFLLLRNASPKIDAWLTWRKEDER